jgi:hypothetical protein
VKPTHVALAASLLAACGRGAPPPETNAAPASATAPAPAAAKVPAAGRGAHVAEGPAPELTLATFRKFTKKRGAEVRRCYEAALQNDPSLRGKLTLTFAVVPGGGVSEVRVAKSTFRSSAVPSCVVTVVRGWRTPFRPEEPVDVEYPIDFGPR